MSIPPDLFYTADHEWVVDPGGPIARVGVTAHAAGALGDVVFLDLPEVGSTVTAGSTCGEIESTKSVSDLFSPVSGTVEEVNTSALDAPELVNADPYGEGWLFTVRVSDPTPAGLLDAAAYAGLPDVGA
ncbi:MAG: glycine cleavage system protein GcvH [Micrococcales bacterium]|nr:glycine cleavage system protein GcvH [Micrococcales bacterium]